MSRLRDKYCTDWHVVDEDASTPAIVGGYYIGDSSRGFFDRNTEADASTDSSNTIASRKK